MGTGGTGGAVVYDRDGCERRQSECFAAVDALCAVLDSYDCDHLVQECSSAYDACLRSWVATCPRGGERVLLAGGALLFVGAPQRRL